jgi:HAD superfamily hydrolase (TIGR01509 family)
MDLHFSTAVFDMDGTLFSTEQLAIDALATAFSEHGVQIPLQALEFVIGLASKETRAYFGQLVPTGPDPEQVLRRGGELFRARIDQDGVPIKSGVLKLLAYLHRRGTTMAVATSTRTATAMDNLRRAGIAHYFGAVIGGDAVPNAKPAPDVYLRALSELRAAPDDAIAVEDSDHGIKSAYAAGLRVIFVPDIKRIASAIEDLAYRRYATLDELHAELAQASWVTPWSHLRGG